MVNHVKRHQTNLRVASLWHLHKAILIFPKYEVQERKAQVLMLNRVTEQF